jgi:hypothetical protein
MCFRSLAANGVRFTPREERRNSTVERDQAEINRKKANRSLRNKLKKKKKVLSKPKQTAMQ